MKSLTDRELAVKFAEFLGWHIESMCWCDAEGELKAWAGNNDDFPWGQDSSFLWNPCTDLNQAWLAETKYSDIYIELRSYPMGEGHARYRCWVTTKTMEGFAQSHHPARALVEAILKVVGERGE